ncbi:MAG: helicase-exonuclease AddAB subunit AddA [Schaedlerella sp.]|nr:helicase-exonuclease AddAB subunit AddA [Schaedlerella sp.]
MGVKWTEEQKKVINLRNRNILVSAAAGSGKTAVLVERIIQMLTDTIHPLEVDQLLIVTFTEAAASEMKERIRNAIENELEKNPEDVHLQRQATLIHSARITTIHSFCLSVIREHFHVIDLDPSFRIVEEGELQLLKKDVLEEVFEECYDSQEAGFLALTEKLGGTKNDKKLEEQVLKLYEYSRSYPQPEVWLAQCTRNYEIENMQNNIFFDKAVRYIYSYLQDMIIVLEKGLEICEEPDGPYMHAEVLEKTKDMLSEVIKMKDFQKMHQSVSMIKFPRLSTKKDASVDLEKRQAVKELMEQVRKQVKEINETFFYEKPEELIQDIRSASSTMRSLINLVEKFAETLAAKKSSKNMIDFGDMEQFALKILTENVDGKLVPSAVAKEYQDQFVEIMIDEYQDSNLIQETILTSVSRMNRGQNNIFMVGDVKQSIYRFRLSRPELFMEKYEQYNIEESDVQRIDLHKNFRSRHEVLDSTNYIFRQIMKKQMGGVEYDDQAALYPGAEFLTLLDKNGDTANATELILIDGEDKDEKPGKKNQVYYKEDSARQLEAHVVAKKIKELLRNHKVIDKKTGEFRRVQYRDIVILTRSISGWADTFASVLIDEGLPAYADSREGYFETYEVSVLLDYLKLLDNQRQDIPLAAVLTSPFVGMSAKELTKIRMFRSEGQFFEAAEAFLDSEEDNEVKKKLKNFYSDLKRYRKNLPYLTIHELLWKILEETGYKLYISSMPGGEQRKANIEMLVEKAAAFEKTSYKGLFHFVRYIEQLKKYNVDYGEANYVDEQSDTIRIMSIHKSKGLEFPIVIVAGMGKRFNMTDSSASVVIHPELGVGIDEVNLENRTKVPTLIKKVIQQEVQIENLGEELRVLYVAMTRAKEKLILTGQLKDAESFMQNAVTYGYEIPFYILSGAKKYLDWILPAIVGKKSPIKYSIWNYWDAAVIDQIEGESEEIARDVLENWDINKVYNWKLKEHLHEVLSYKYPYESYKNQKQKFTVSELKKRFYMKEDGGEMLVQEPETIPLLPDFRKETEELTGASRGNVYHKLMELLDHGKKYDRKLLGEQIRHLYNEEKLTEEMTECIRETDIMNFFESSVGKRMHEAAEKGLLYKEQPFVLGVDAKTVYPEDKSGEILLIQGIIDVFFEEDGELVLLDYKTDRVYSEKILKDRYQVQLDYYSKALEQIMQKKVKDKVIYSFTLGKEIHCNK